MKHENDQIFAHTQMSNITFIKCKSHCTDVIFSDYFINGTEALFYYIYVI